MPDFPDSSIKNSVDQISVFEKKILKMGSSEFLDIRHNKKTGRIYLQIYILCQNSSGFAMSILRMLDPCLAL